jgi:citrate synthase
MDHAVRDASADFIESLCAEYQKHNQIDPAFYERYRVKRGLRNADGTGVMAGVTQIGNVMGYYVQDGERIPAPGKLVYRGIDVEELINGFVSEGRFGFEETAYLLLFGALPTRAQLTAFEGLLSAHRALPPMFTEDMILKAPSPDVMNKLARSVLALYSYDGRPDDMSLPNQLRQAVELIARVPVIVAHAFAAKRHYYDNESLYLHRPQEGLSVAQNFLYSVRHDNRYTDEEARLLDLCLVLHAEHGGGNNSAFACRVLSSSGTDIYSSIAAAVGSLKGPLHGGANAKVMEMFHYIQENVDPHDDGSIRDYLVRLLDGEAGDCSGKLYGLGHAVYTMSDPRAVLLKKYARHIAQIKGYEAEFDLLQKVEELGIPLVQERRHSDTPMCANVDMYSGLVYTMLGIPEDVFTPLFASARIAGWCANRMEEVITGHRIMRPAYRAVTIRGHYVPMEERTSRIKEFDL